MAQKGLFFNAFPNEEYETGYDRNYSADDISNWLEVVLTTGVIKTNNVSGTGETPSLKVVADSGLKIKVNSGLAVLKGKPYINDSQLSFDILTPPTSGTRYDCLILRMDNTQIISARRTYILTRRLNAEPTLENLERGNNVYELLLGYVKVQANVTSVSQSDIEDTRGDEDLCPWCTAVKGYEDYYDAIVQRFEYDETLSSAGTIVTTDLAVRLYNNKYSLVSVYCNGLREDEEDYSVITTGSYIQIRFNATKSAGAQISVVLENFIDGEGLSNVLSQYNELVAEVEDLAQINEFNYYCNGNDDNVQISNIIKTFINNTANAYKTIKLNVIGTLGINAPAGGDGTGASPYKIFDIGANSNNCRWELDFSHAGQVYYQLSTGKQHIFFFGANGHIVNLSCNILNNSLSTSVKVFSDSEGWLVENSRFIVNSYQDTIIAYAGTFVNCKARVHNASGASWCFFARASKLLSIIGGEYTAYTADSSARSAVVGETGASNVVMTNVNAPTIARSGEYQTLAIYQTAGKLSIFGLVSALTITKTSDAQVLGTIAVSVPEQCY